MRRISPMRGGRRFGSPRRRSRHRSVSPIAMPIPPGLDDLSILPKWSHQRPPERQRPRSRSREKMPRPRDRSRERQRDIDRKDKHQSGKHLRDRNREHPHFQDNFRPFKEEIPGVDMEESYLDGQPINFHSNFNGPVSLLHDVQGSGPSGIPNRRGRSPRRSPIRHRPRRSPNRGRPSPVRTSPNALLQPTEKNENVDRIDRLEKLVEKLVQGNVTSNNPSLMDSGTSRNENGIPELIPSNTKFTTSMWLNNLHQECLDRNYNEKLCIKYVQNKMTGIMKAWFKTVSTYDFTWPELKLLITKTFPDNVDFAQTLRMLVQREKFSEETITQYFFSKMYLCEACKITGENAVSCLIDGLPNPFMKQDMQAYNFLTPESLFAELLLRFHNNDKVGPSNREVETYEGSLRDFRKEEDNRGQPSFKNEGGRCATCKKFGHFTVDCRHAPICYKCKKKGHIAAKCAFVGLLNQKDSKNCGYLIICEVNGLKLQGQVDTGCAVVTVQKGVAKKLCLAISPSSNVLTGYGGGIINVIGEARVILKVDGTEKLTSVLIVPDKHQEFPFIIGRDYLDQDGVAVLIEGKKLKVLHKDKLDPSKLQSANIIIGD
ncbi:uncharacterized protein LOC132698356 [Cylas formicarius]|uniref:uncharacterized protein LOC132698356 n=1 Tax=Cylas formicarius TaxID=197179 RepID=UPI0029589D70|nr:uncharacterized protein LOC132698356 [Cylas formicarius]XP_060520348.1 uncharacterized protein LOC132698356 [Cylas formicarius]